MDQNVKFEFSTLKKEAVKDMIERQTFDLDSRQAFDQKLRDLKKENYVLEFHPVK